MKEPLAATPTPLLEQIMSESPGSLLPGESVIGACLDARHPSLLGRVLVQWSAPSGAETSAWLPALHGLVVRDGDRVLLTRPSNAPEPIVVGVVDGFAARPEARRETAAQLELRADEALRVTSTDGTPLVEVFHRDGGPVVRLLAGEVSLDLPGDLHLSARSVALIARGGEMKISARDDVIVVGETINLNS